MKKNAKTIEFQPYSTKIEEHIKSTFQLFSEKDRRLYIAAEAEKLPRGGITYLATLVNCSRNLIYAGLKQLDSPEEIPINRIRKIGGGKKAFIDTKDNIDEIFFEVIQEHIAGDPMDDTIKWTNLSHKQISKKMTEKGVVVGRKVVKQLLMKHGFKKRKALKNQAIGSSENRNEQFENIISIKSEYLQKGNPIISMDSKKRTFR